MPRIYVSVGSNVHREINIRSAVRDLAHRFGTLVLSSVYESSAVGFEGADFLNMVVGFETHNTPSNVAGVLKDIEDAHGRDRTSPRFSDRTLDLDLLLYGNQVVREPGLSLPRDEIVAQAFVLAPLAEIAGEETHPVIGESYRKLWQSFDAGEPQLRRVQLDLGDLPDGTRLPAETPP
ncbi:MAG: 2-amino-4-hydroxy-6-hydroxymethyldihydropteridine diphosphokinase [Gammaproteobacteria bacterium]|nr:2-amino-4-hydroxy-6-hydroxymethyldihydropteridine diphosphokinase [Gammaproteobacteria bacterium]